MNTRTLDSQAMAIESEYSAARTELGRAETEITSLAGTGFPIEQMDLEFQVLSRARAALRRIQEGLDRFAAIEADGAT